MKHTLPLLLLSFSLALPGCSKNDQEKAKQNLDKAGQKVEQAAEKAAQGTKKAADKAVGAVKDATDSRPNEAAKDRREDKPSAAKKKAVKGRNRAVAQQ